MQTPEPHLIKQREIGFCALHPDPRQVRAAQAMLRSIHGVLTVEQLAQHRLQLSYDLRHVCLQILEEALSAAGFHLDNSLLTKLRRALWYYTEDVQLQRLSCAKGEGGCAKRVFVRRYERLRHGCRDQRPEHWRRYW